jgi:ribosomal protein S27AE
MSEMDFCLTITSFCPTCGHTVYVSLNEDVKYWRLNCNKCGFLCGLKYKDSYLNIANAMNLIFGEEK